MPTAKTADTTTTSSSSSSSAPSGDKPAGGLSFALPGEKEPDTVTATFGDEGEDPHEVGFVGTKPKD
jgi:hypothetical protein